MSDTPVLRVLSLGAGVQSSTIALMVALGQLPMLDAAIFADTQHEPASVYKWLDWLEQQLPFPVYRVTKGSLKAEALRKRLSRNGNLYTRASPPAFMKMPERVVNGETQPEKQGLMMRQCTADFKIKVINKEVNRLRRESKKLFGVRPQIEEWIGISTDEAHRMKPSRLDYIHHTFPLIERGMSRADCILWMAEHSYPRPPRSSCTFCPYHDDDEWIRLRDNEPEAFAEAVQFDHDFRDTMDGVSRGVPFLHRSMVPLDQVKFVSGENKNAFGNECEGMCGN